jgi:predicted transcriptional regulator
MTPSVTRSVRDAFAERPASIQDRAKAKLTCPFAPSCLEGRGDDRFMYRFDAMSTTKVKEEAQRLIQDLPEDAMWDDLMRRIYVPQAIEAGLADSDAGRTMDVKTLREKRGLPA